MKKVSLQSLISFIDSMNAQGSAPQEIMEIRDEIANELAKGAEKAQANRDLYTAAHDVVIDALSDAPATIAEIYEAIKDNLPDGMTKAKVQYAITRLWKDEIVKVDGSPCGYRKA